MSKGARPSTELRYSFALVFNNQLVQRRGIDRLTPRGSAGRFELSEPALARGSEEKIMRAETAAVALASPCAARPPLELKRSC